MAKFARVRSRNLLYGVSIGIAAGMWGGFVAPCAAIAAVTTTGQVTPAPPAGGGNLAGALFVGDTLFGTLTINGGTPLNLTNGSATVGNTVTGFGIATLTGFGSNLSTAVANADLTIGSAGTGSVSVSNSAQIIILDDLFLAANPGGSGSLFIDGLGTIVDIGDQVQVGQFDAGVIEVTAGGRMLADDTVIGQNSSGEGWVTVSGSQSLWRSPQAMTVGDLGRGVLQVLGGGRMETLNIVVANGSLAFGNVEVAGAGSVWEITGFMTLGVFGTSTIQISDGGRITNTSSARLATMAGSESRVEVSGANTQWAVGTTLTVGEFGFGRLDILDGGRVTSTNVIIGDNPNSRGEATVDGDGSLWEITGTIDVSDIGNGEAKLAISNGGLVTTTGVTRVNAVGELVLDGGRLSVLTTSGTTNQGLIRGGGTITGLVTNTAAGEIRINSGDKLLLGNNLTNQGLINVDGGELEVLGTATNTLDIDVRDSILRFQSALSNNSGGQLAIVGGDVDVFGSITNAVNAQVVVGGDALAAFHDAFTNNGALFVTSGAELLTLENLGFGSGASLNIQLAEADPDGGFGQVNVAGSASIAGTLNVELASGYAPALGDSFQIVTAGGGRSGFFANENLPALSGGLGWDVQYNPNSVVLSVVGTVLFGDYNDNGIVDAADYAVWRNFNGTATTLPNDSTPGQVDALDYTQWRTNFGQSGGAGAVAGGAVPEPAAALLLLVGILMISLRMRGR